MNDAGGMLLQTANMAKKSKALHYLREWREFRRMTQEQLAAAVDTDKSVISLLESGGRGMSDKWARRLAPALGTTPGFLLDHDPENLDTAFIEAALSVPIKDREQALKILQTFKTGTDG